MVWKDAEGQLEVYMGTITSAPLERVDLARRNETRISLQVSFFDPAAELRIFRALQSRGDDTGTRVLVATPRFPERISDS